MAGRILVLALLALGVTAARADAQKCEFTKFAEWPVRVEAHRLLLDVTINGQNVQALVHLGSPGTLILRSAAARLGLVLYNTDLAARSAVGDRYVDYTFVDELRIGQVSSRNWRAYVVNAQDYGPNTALILGYDFFRRRDFELDVPHKALRLFKAEGCGDTSLAYWARGSESRLSLKGSDDRIAIDAQINDRTVDAILDSGIAASTISQALARRVGTSLDSFTLGKEKIHNPRLQVVDSPFERVSLGADFLQAHRVFVAHSQGRFYFTYEGGPVFNPDAAH